MRWLLCALVVIAACGDSSNTAPSGGSSGLPNQSSSSSGSSGASSSGSTKNDGGDTTGDPDSGPPIDLGPANVRIMAANISSGNKQSYDDGEGTRIFQGLKPDIAMIQEFNFGDKSDIAIRQFVTTAFGENYDYYREPTGNIPNGVISRYPIVAKGTFESGAPDRGFAWAKITVPGTHPLYAFSIHLLTANPATRKKQADDLLADIKTMVLDGDLIVLGGDFNTDTRTEACLTTLQEVVDSANSHAADNKGNQNTNANRGKPYDWVLASPNLVAHEVATTIGANSFPSGLVFDSRVYTPLGDVAPVQQGDSGSQNMQHMAVIKDFHLE